MRTTETCQNCGKGELEIIETRPGYIIKRGFTGRKGPQYYGGTKKFLTEACPKCGAYHGEKQGIQNKRILQLKEAGIPLIIRSEQV